MAVRVTSEDPDDGFKPTSGKVQKSGASMGKIKGDATILGLKLEAKQIMNRVVATKFSMGALIFHLLLKRSRA